MGLRLITATNRDLEQVVQAGRFRADLYYRITVAATTLPPLREIKRDLPHFANHFREAFNREFKKRVESIDGAALEALEAWQWPGNVRELRNVIERAMIFSDAPTLQRSDLPTLGRLERVTRGGTAGTGGTEPRDDAIQVPKGLTLVEAEREYIRATLSEVDGNVQRAAEILGISRKNLWEKRKKYGLLETSADGEGA